MYFLIGRMFGPRIADMAGEANGYEDAFKGIFWWSGLVCVGFFATGANFGREYALGGAASTALLIFLYIVRKPLRSPFKTMMLCSISVVASIGLLIMVVRLALLLGWAILSGKFKIEGWNAVSWQHIVYEMLLGISCFAVIVVIAFVLDAGNNIRPAPPLEKNDTGSETFEEVEGPAGRTHTNKRELNTQVPWWKVLGVDPDCSDDDALAKVKSLIAMYHPDKHHQALPMFQKTAADHTRNILAARDEILARKKSRAHQ